MAGKLGAHIRANAVAYLALFVALGGTSYAAIRLPANSVGTKQLRSGAVTSAKVRYHSLTGQDLQAGVLRRGPRGPEGPAGAVAGTLPSGKTLRGRFEAGSGSPNGNTVGSAASGSISFGAQLAAPPARTIVQSAPGPSQCPGSVANPEAAPGHLCIYVGEKVNISAIDTILEGGATGATSRQGAGVYVISSAAGTFGARGSWAVTAP
jgi:hypothetical protein